MEGKSNAFKDRKNSEINIQNKNEELVTNEIVQIQLSEESIKLLKKTIDINKQKPEVVTFNFKDKKERWKSALITPYVEWENAFISEGKIFVPRGKVSVSPEKAFVPTERAFVPIRKSFVQKVEQKTNSSRIRDKIDRIAVVIAGGTILGSAIAQIPGAIIGGLVGASYGGYISFVKRKSVQNS